MNLKSLEVFYWVVHHASFNKAAVMLHTTQPAVSQRIAALESELGFKVIDRGQKIRTTARGRVLYEYAERFIALQAEMLTRVTESSSISGVVRVGMAETIVHTWLMSFLKESKRRHPDLIIDIVVDVTPTLREALKSGELDLAFVLGPRLGDDMVEQPLCEYNLQFFASPSLNLGSRVLDREALVSQTIITFPKTTYPYPAIKRALTIPQLPAPRIITNYSLSTIVKMTEEGFGVCVVPGVAVSKEVLARRLQRLRTELTLETLEFCVSYVPGKDEQIKSALAALSIEMAAAHRTQISEGTAANGADGPLCDAAGSGAEGDTPLSALNFTAFRGRLIR